MNSSFAKNALKIMSGNVIARIISFASIAVIARLYTPGQFGIAELFMTFLFICLTFSSLSYEYAISLPEKESDSFSVVQLALSLLIFFTALIAVSSFIFYYMSSGISSLEDIRIYIFFLPILVFVRGSRDVLELWFSRKRRFGRIAMSEIINKLGEVGFKIGLAGIGTAGLFWGNIAGFAISASAYLTILIRKDRGLISLPSLSAMKSTARRYSGFPKFNILSTMSKSLTERLPTLIITPFFGFTATGLYSMAFKLINEPMKILSTSMSRVYEQDAAREYNKNGSIARLTEDIFDKLLLMSFMPIAFIGVASEELFTVVLGSTWSEAGVYTEILAASMLVRFLIQPLSYALNIVEKQHLNMIFNSALSVFALLSFFAGGALGSIYAALIFFSASYTVISLIYLSFILMNAGASAARIFRRSSVQIAAAMPPIALIITMKHLRLHPVLFILLALTAGGLYYAFMLRFYLRKNNTSISALIKMRKNPAEKNSEKRP